MRQFAFERERVDLDSSSASKVWLPPARLLAASREVPTSSLTGRPLGLAGHWVEGPARAKQCAHRSGGRDRPGRRPLEDRKGQRGEILGELFKATGESQRRRINRRKKQKRNRRWGDFL
eukprot:GHVT01101576.1.p2 GENE.GHVT01101576.1~~GHVT01101576.1.p2  ORF type:complete len:119 (-),score=10.99 GHVT01101576.1:17-373(-)